MKVNGKRHRRACGPAQMGLFPHEELARCAGGPRKLECRARDVAVSEEDGLKMEAGGRGGSQLVALWHDRSWNPVRVFRRGERRYGRRLPGDRSGDRLRHDGLRP